MFNLLCRNKESKAKEQPEFFFELVRSRFTSPVIPVNAEDIREEIARIDSLIARLEPIEVRELHKLESCRKSLMTDPRVTEPDVMNLDASYRRLDMDKLIEKTMLRHWWRGYKLPGFALFYIKDRYAFRIERDPCGYSWSCNPEFLQQYTHLFKLTPNYYCEAELSRGLNEKTHELIFQSHQDFDEIYLLGQVHKWSLRASVVNERPGTVSVSTSGLVVVGQKGKFFWLVERKASE